MTRMEELLTALINGETVSFEPQSRMEKYLKNCCDKCGCEGLPEPQSRGEVLLAQLAEMLKNGGGESAGPTAYTVTSVDELPSNAVDGSLAVVESDSIEGSWQFDCENPLDFSDLNLTGDENTSFSVNIRGYNEMLGSAFSTFQIICIGGVIQLKAEGVLVYDSDNGWDDNFDPFELFTDVLYLSTSAPFTEDDFRQFIKTNAERLSGGYSLYTRENGEWVYKCEVV